MLRAHYTGICRLEVFSLDSGDPLGSDVAILWKFVKRDFVATGRASAAECHAERRHGESVLSNQHTGGHQGRIDTAVETGIVRTE